MSIENYGELKAEIKKYLWNRKDLEEQIPILISLMERKTFRNLRIPVMETLLNYEPFDGTADAEPLGYAQLELPGDFLECKFLLNEDNPMTRISDIKIQQKLFRSSAVGTTKNFARVGNRFFLWPVSDDPAAVFTMSYWSDFSGTMVEDDDSNEMLRLAPDLYIYGTCLEFAPFLVNDSRLPVWQTLFDNSFAQLEEQYKEAEYAGSNVQVSSIGQGDHGDYASNGRYY